MMKSDLKKTGNLPVDMVLAACDHYKKNNRKIVRIGLKASYWKVFSKWIKENMPELVFDDQVQLASIGKFHRNVVIRKGHRFMTQNIEIEFEKPQIIGATA